MLNINRVTEFPVKKVSPSHNPCLSSAPDFYHFSWCGHLQEVIQIQLNETYFIVVVSDILNCMSIIYPIGSNPKGLHPDQRKGIYFIYLFVFFTYVTLNTLQEITLAETLQVRSAL